MARKLQLHLLDLLLQAAQYEHLEGVAVGNVPRSDADAVVWDLASAVRGTQEDGRGWVGATPGAVFYARASLLEDAAGVYETDTTYDVAFNGERTALTPTMTAAAVRQWTAVELLYTEAGEDLAAPTATVRFRVHDGAGDLWWDGGAWAAATTSAHWNTAADIQTNVATLTTTARKFAIRAWLKTSDKNYAPSFYGVRVLYGCRMISAYDDALLRTVKASLIAELRAYGVSEFLALAGEVAAVTVAGAASHEWAGYDTTDVLAVFNLTNDPDEAAELAGVFAAGVWTPAVALGVGDLVRLEFEFRPDVVARRHVDATLIEQLPAVYIGPTGAPVETLIGQATHLVHDLNATPATAIVVSSYETITQALDVRIISELGADVQRIGVALRAWLGGSGYRKLVSPETAQAVTVRQTDTLTETTGTLAQGVVEARARWLLTWSSPQRETVGTTTLASQLSTT